MRTFLLLGLSLLLSDSSFAQLLHFPADFAKYNVKDFGAVGDGITDDTQAIQAAFDADRQPQSQPDYYYPRPKLVYFPAGTYLVSDELRWIGCAFSIQGQGEGHTMIKLADNAPGFDDPANPKAVIRSPQGNYSFRQNLRNLTINVGSGNPGAMGLDYIANNSGAVRDVEILSTDGQGLCGLAMNRTWPGPCLIKNVNVEGFDYGILVGHAEYGPTFEDIHLHDQNIAGISNNGNILPIRRLFSDNQVPAILNKANHGMIILLDSELNGGLSGHCAVQNDKGKVYARNVSATGYQSALCDPNNQLTGQDIAEFLTDQPQSLFPSPQKSLGLAIEETPHFVDNDTSHWVRLTGTYYGDNRSWQDSINAAGKTTVYLRAGVYLASGRVYSVPKRIKRVHGFGSVINGTSQGALTLQVIGGGANSAPLVIEQFGYGLTIEHRSKRPLVIKHGKYNYVPFPDCGKVYFEDVELKESVFDQGNEIWARQLNTESPGNNVINDGSRLWIMGIKTERKGTVITTKGGGYTELFGSLLYPTRSFSASDDPAFVNIESSHSLIYGTSSYVNNGNYPVQVRETRNGITKELPLADLSGRFMPLFVGYQDNALNIDEEIDAVGLHNFPNPFSERTSFSIELDEVTELDLRIYDVQGKELAVLMKGSFGPGTYTPVFDGRSYVPGLYFFHLQKGEERIGGKMMLLR
ncbi:MAG: glycosyl hydrolase family 28-related protein [Bacteroidota bacterium]